MDNALLPSPPDVIHDHFKPDFWHDVFFAYQMSLYRDKLRAHKYGSAAEEYRRGMTPSPLREAYAARYAQAEWEAAHAESLSESSDEDTTRVSIPTTLTSVNTVDVDKVAGEMEELNRGRSGLSTKLMDRAKAIEANDARVLNERPSNPVIQQTKSRKTRERENVIEDHDAQPGDLPTQSRTARNRMREECDVEQHGGQPSDRHAHNTRGRRREKKGAEDLDKRRSAPSSMLNADRESKRPRSDIEDVVDRSSPMVTQVRPQKRRRKRS